MKRVYELDVYADLKDPLRGRHAFGTNRQKRFQIWLDTTEENKLWLRKLISRKVLSESNAAEYKAIVEKLGPKKIECVHQQYKSIKATFPISTFRERFAYL